MQKLVPKYDRYGNLKCHVMLYDYEQQDYCNLSTKKELLNGKYIYKCQTINDYVALDIETTGLSPKTNEIINIGAIRYRNNLPVDEFDVLVKPEHRIPAFITELTGISNAMVAKSPCIGSVLPLLIDFIGRDIILGHNVKFDINFLNYAMEAHGYDDFITKYMDTMWMARSFRKNNSLEILVRDYVNPNYIEKHTGLDDAKHTAKLFLVLRDKIAGRGC